MRSRSLAATITYFVGMVALLVGERAIGAGVWRGVASTTGVGLIGLAMALRLVRIARAEHQARRVEGIVTALYGLGILSLLLYALQSDLLLAIADRTLDRTMPRVATALAALWPALWIAAALPLLLVEMAYGSMIQAGHAAPVELGRIRDAVLSGFGLAFVLVFAFSATYIATQRDRKADLSYFRTAKVGESTRKIVRTLDQVIEVSLFFPPASEVREEVETYFTDLERESKLLEVKRFDHAVDVAAAKERSVTSNGIVVIARGARREQLHVGSELEAARSRLKNLDREVQKRLLQVARPMRTAYFVVGHGERATDGADDTDKRRTIRDLRELMSQQGHQVRNLGSADGLAADVPSDAAALLIVGPQKPLLTEEIAAIGRYFNRGGRIFIALDPEAGSDFKELLDPLGVRFVPTTLANDQIYVRQTAQPSDRANIATGSFSSHPSVTALSHLGMQAPFIALGAGAFEALEGRAKEITVDFTAHAHAATWSDTNGDFTFDAATEKRKAWELAAAVTKQRGDGKPAESGRAILLADSDGLTDGVVGNRGNSFFVIDGMKWLLGDEAIAGEIASEVETPIAHTRKQDAVWFYLTIFVGPLGALGLGVAVRRRRPRARSRGDRDAGGERPLEKEAAA